MSWKQDTVIKNAAIRTYQEVADILGVRKQAVQKIERRAFTKIRKALWRERMEIKDL